MDLYILNTLKFIIPFCISYLISFFLIPKLLKYGKIYSLMDLPNERKIHSNPIIRIGGFSFFLGTGLGLIITNLFYFLFDNQFFNLIIDNRYILPIFLGSLAFYLIGLFDDILSLSPFFRLFLQFLTAIFIFSNNIQIKYLYVPFLSIGSNYIHLPIFQL